MKRLSIAVLFILFTFQCFSQSQSGKQSFSLRECLETALANNPDVKLSNSQISAAAAQLTSAFGSFLPSLDFNWGYSRQLNADGGKTINVGGQTINIGATEPNSFNMSAIASISLFNGFAREKNYSMAKNNLDAQYLLVRNTIQKTYLTVYKEYVEVVRNLQIVKVRKDNLELGRKSLERIQARFDAGAVQKMLVYSQEAENANREYELINAENTLNISKSNLLITMGMSPDNSVDFEESSLPGDLSDSDRESFSKAIGTYEQAYSKALSDRPDYQASKLNITSAKAGISAASSSYYPSLAASGGWSWSNSQFNNFSEYGRSFIGLSLNVPIFDNFSTNFKIENSKLQLIQAEIQQFNLEQGIKNSLKAAFFTLESAEKQLDVTQRALKFAEMNYESLNEGLKVGSVTATDLLLANNTLVNAQINRITAVYNYFLAQKEILFTIGQINQ